MHAFRELAEVFQKLERTSSSLTLITILAEFLSGLNPDEAKAVAYLLRGELAPAFESLEIGMAERMVVRAVADAYTVPEQRVERLLTTTGDLGTVAETLAGAKRGRAGSILSVFGELQKIARASGKGSQQEKCSKLARLSPPRPLPTKQWLLCVNIMPPMARLSFILPISCCCCRCRWRLAFPPSQRRGRPAI